MSNQKIKGLRGLIRQANLHKATLEASKSFISPESYASQIAYYDDYIAKQEFRISKIEQKQTRNKQVFGGFIVLLLVIGLVFFIRLEFIGYVTYTNEEIEYQNEEISYVNEEIDMLNISLENGSGVAAPQNISYVNEEVSDNVSIVSNETIMLNISLENKSVPIYTPENLTLNISQGNESGVAPIYVPENISFNQSMVSNETISIDNKSIILNISEENGSGVAPIYIPQNITLNITENVALNISGENVTGVATPQNIFINESIISNISEKINLPLKGSVDSIIMEPNMVIKLDLDEYFFDEDNLTYDVDEHDYLEVVLSENFLTITSREVGEYGILLYVEDGYNLIATIINVTVESFVTEVNVTNVTLVKITNVTINMTNATVNISNMTLTSLSAMLDAEVYSAEVVDGRYNIKFKKDRNLVSLKGVDVAKLKKLKIKKDKVIRKGKNGLRLGTDLLYMDIIVTEANLSLAKTGPVNTIVKCIDEECLTWETTSIPFTDNGTHISFTVDSFSGYGGAYITIIDLQSYPMVGGTWTVRFNTTGVANLTISASNGTTYGTEWPDDLEWLGLKCGGTVMNPDFNETHVFYEDWNCSDIGYHTVKVHTPGSHYQMFEFGDDIGYASNWAKTGTVYDCENCSDCSSALADASSGDTVILNKTITNDDGDCIDFSGADGVTFDCGGNNIEGDKDSDGKGIDIDSGEDDNTIQNCPFVAYFNNNVQIGGLRPNITNSSFYNSSADNLDVSGNNATMLYVNVIDSGRRGIYLDANYCSFINVLINNTDTTSSGSGEGVLSGLFASYNTFDNLNVTNADEGLRIISGQYNTIMNSRFYDNSVYGIYLDYSIIWYTGNNTFYNNYLNNTQNVYSDNALNTNSWNTSEQSGTNIMLGQTIGGNYYSDPDGNYSDSCTDSSSPWGICENSYTVATGNVDYLPLTKSPEPYMSLISPSNGHSTSDTTISFNCTATDDTDLKNVTLYTNISGTWTKNLSDSCTGVSAICVANFTVSVPTGNFIWNCLTYDSSDYTDWGDQNASLEITSGKANGEACTTGDECLSVMCIEGFCRAACAIGYDDDRCSNDTNTYDNAASGVCARNNGGTWSCDKDEVAQTAGDDWTDCYEVDAGSPAGVYTCDSDVNPAYSTEGMCTYSTGGATVGTVNCDTAGETCYDGSIYRNDCSNCGFATTDNDACDPDGGSAYSADGICVNGGTCDQDEVCTDAQATGDFYSDCSNAACEDGNACQVNVGTSFTRDGRCYGNDCCNSIYAVDGCNCISNDNTQCDSTPNAGSGYDGICTDQAADTCCVDGNIVSNSAANYYCSCSNGDGRACDSSMASQTYTQDGVCVSGSTCSIDEVCLNAGTYYEIADCTETWGCDDDVDPGYGETGDSYNNDGTMLCCDSTEDYEHSEAGGSCCYNSAILSNGSSSSSVLCFDGELFDCNDQVVTAPDADSNNVTGDQLGSVCCGAGNDWDTANCPLADCDYFCDSCSNCTTTINSASAGETVCMSENITATGDCVGIQSDITFDCQGYSLTGNGSGIGIHNSTAPGPDNTVISNCNIYNYSKGIFLRYVDNSTIIDVGLYNNSASEPGIDIGNGNNVTLENIIAEGNYIGVSFNVVTTSNMNNVTANENTKYGLEIAGTYNNFSNITVIDNADHGIYMSTGCDNNIFNDIIAINNTNSAILIWLGTQNSFTDVNVTIQPGELGLDVDSSTVADFMNNFTNVYVNNIRIHYFGNDQTPCPDDQIINLSQSPYLNNISHLQFIACDNVTIMNGKMDISDGVFFSFTNNSRLENMVINRSTIGVILYKTYSTELFNVSVNNNSKGISIDPGYFSTFTDITATGNNYGLYFDGSTFNELINLTLRDNNIGIRMDLNSDSNNISGSIITDNAIGIDLEDMFGGPTSNLFFNNFFNNTENVFSNSDSNTNYWNISLTAGTNIMSGSWIGGNFWTDPDGNFSDNCTDADENGICDADYNLVRNEWDYEPLTLGTQGAEWDTCSPTTSADLIINETVSCNDTTININSLNVTSTGWFNLSNVTLITGQNTIMSSGRFTIIDSHDTIWQNGNWTISGFVNITNTTIRMNGTDNGSVGINVTSTGWLIINESSNITNGDTASAEFFFIVNSGSNFSMEHSYLSECGWANNTNQRGLEIWTQDSLITNSTIKTSYYAISLYNSSNNIYNNIINNTLHLYVADGPNYLNTSLQTATNIMGGNYIGGNYWTNSTGNGYSDTCDDYVSPWGICDAYLNLSNGTSIAVDYLPLSSYSNIAPNMTLHSPPNASSTTDDYVILNATVYDGNNHTIDTNLYVYYADEIDSSETALWTGLVALYHFNNDSSVGENDTLVYDWSGQGNNATVNGSIWSDSGRFSGAFEFDGIDDRINCGNDSSLSFSGKNFTISVWFKSTDDLSQVANEKGILTKIKDGGGSSNAEMMLYYEESNGKIQIETYDTVWVASVTNQTTWAEDIWYHLAVMFNGSHVDWYVNGMHDNKESFPYTFQSTPHDLQIGRFSSDIRTWNGSIDELAIFNRSLSAQEVFRLYDKGRWKLVYSNTSMPNGTNINYNLTSMPLSVQEDMVLLMHFDNDSSMGENDTLVYDWTGLGNNGTTDGDPELTITKFGLGFNFSVKDIQNISIDDSSGYFDMIAGTSNMTISAWVYPLSYTDGPGSNGDGTIAQIYEDDFSDGFAFSLADETGKNNGLIVFTQGANTGTQCTGYVQINEWQHLAAVFEQQSDTVEIYHNGIKCYENNSYTETSGVTNGYVLIGNSHTKANLNGTIDDLAIWNRSLSASEIANIYSLQAGRYYWRGNVTGGSLSGESEVWWFEINESIVVPNISFVSPTPANGTTQSETFVEINVSINTTSLDAFVWNWNGTNYTLFNDSLVLMINFDNVSALGENNTHVVDVSGQGNNGTVVGGNVTTASGKYGGAMIFDGINDYVNMGNDSSLDLNGSDEFTLMTWVYYKSPISAWPIIIGKGGADTYSIQTYDVTDRYGFWGHIGIEDIDDTSGSVLPFDTWSHVTLSYNGSFINYYLNGQLDGGVAATGVVGTNSTNSLMIGRSPDSVWCFKGSIDEVRIYNRSLSTEEIQILYMSNLRKYDTDKWLFYINQSKNATSGLDEGIYTYQAFAKDTADNWNQTVKRWITIGAVLADCTGTDPVANSNWVIDDTTSCANVNISMTSGYNITVNGNLTLINVTLVTDTTNVNAGGNVQLVDSPGTIWQNGNWTISGFVNITNTTIRMNGTDNGSVGINVTSTGWLIINESSNITNGDTASAEFFFIVNSGSNFSMEHSYLSECGWANNTNQRGLEIWTQDSLITNSTIKTSYYAISLYNSSNNIYNNIINNTLHLYVADGPNYLNTSLQTATNIMGGNYIGGNYWTNSTGNGYSDTCDDYVSPWGICDAYLNLSNGTSIAVDYLPLSSYSNIAPNMTLHSPPNASSTTDDYVILNATVYDGNNHTIDTNLYVYYADEIDASLETGLVALYHFNNDSSVGENDTFVYDWSGNGNNGTVNGSSWSDSGRFEGAFDFDGSNDYVDCGDINETDSVSELTVCAWLKTDEEDSAGLVGKDASDSNSPKNHTWLLYKTSGTDTAAFYVSATASSWDASIAGNTTINDNEWNHICGVYMSTSDLKLYVDGASEGIITGIEPASLRSNDLSVKIGKWGNESYLNGTIDEVVIYNRSLSAQEIFRLYDKGRYKLVYSNTSMPNGTNINYNLTAMPLSVQEGMVLLMHFNNDSGESTGLGGNVYDYTGYGNNGTLGNGTAGTNPSWNTSAGKFGGAFVFDGVDDIINLSKVNDDFNTDEGSFAMWFIRYWSDGYGHWVTPFLIANSLNTSPTESIQFYWVPSNGTWIFSRVGNGTDNVLNIDSSLAPQNQWTFIVMTWSVNQDEWKLYFDGVQEGSTLTGLKAWNGSVARTEIPDYENPELNGTIDEFAVWNRSLNASEILAMYSLQAGRYYWRGNVTDGSLSGESEIWWFEINATESSAPNITLHLPANASTTTNSYVVLNATITDDSDDIDTNLYIYYADEISNTSYNPVLLSYLFNNDTGENDTYIMDQSGNSRHAFSNDDNATNADGNTTASLIEGKYKNSLILDGLDDYVRTYDSDFLDGQDNGSWSLWFKLNSLMSDEQTLIDYSTVDDSSSLMQFVISESGYLRILWKPPSTGSWDAIDASTPLNIGQWHHVAFVADGVSRIKIYLDGIELSTSYNSGSGLGSESDWLSDIRNISTTVHYVYIGGTFRGAIHEEWLNGTIDEVVYFDNPLASQEVLSLYDKGRWKLVYSNTSMASGTNINYNLTSMPLSVQEDMVLLMHFDNDSSMGENDTHVYDWSGMGNNGTAYVNNSDSSTRGPNATGRFGRAYVFDGVDDYVNLGDDSSVDFTDNFTLSAWIKHSGASEAPSGDGWRIITKQDLGAGQDYYILRIDDSSGGPNGVARFAIRINLGTNWGIASSTNVKDGEWHQIIGVREGSEIMLYVDGLLENSTTAESGTIDPKSNLTIGNFIESDSEYFNGSIDEVAIWNRSLTASEISAIYSLQAGRYYWMGNVSDGSLSGESEIWWFEINATNYAPNITLHSPPNASTTTDTYVVLNATVNDDEDNIDTNLYVYYADEIDASLETGLVALYHFNNDTGENDTWVYDWTGHGHNGTVINGSQWKDSGRFKGAFEFDGDNDWITMGDVAEMDGLTQLTASAWVYVNEYAAYQSIFGKIGEDNNKGWVILTGDGSNKDEFFVAARNGDDTYGLTGSDALELGTWQHIAMVFDGTLSGDANRLKFYLDGVQQALTFYLGVVPASIADSTQDFGIGHLDRAGESYLNGTVDEVAVWNRSLSAQEVFRLYDKGRWKLVYSNTSMPNGTNINYNLTSMPLSVQEDMVLLMHFDNDSSMGENDTHVYDWSGTGNNGSCTSCPGYINSCKFGGCFNFTSHYFNVTNDSSIDLGTLNFTINVWFKTGLKDGLPGEGDEIIEKQDSGIFYQMRSPDSNGNVQAQVDDGVSQTKVISDSGDLADQKWHQFVFVRDYGNTASIYIDGILSNSSTDIAGSVSNPADLLIGYGNGGNFNGTIDEVAMWNRSLTASEVSAIYSLQAGRYYWFGNVSDGSLSSESEIWWFEINATYAPNITLHSPQNASSTTDTYVVLNATVTDDSDDIDANLYVYYADEVDSSDSGLWNGLIVLYHFNNDTGENDTLVYDWSGTGNDAICSGATCPTFREGLRFNDGHYYNDDEWNASDSASLSFPAGSNFTFQAWIKIDQCLSSGSKFVSKKLGQDSIELNCYPAGDLDWRVRDSAGIFVGTGTETNLTDNKWHHILGVKDGNNLFAYVDGKLEGNASGAFIGNWNDGDLKVGDSVDAGARYTVGLIDEVAVWNRALSAQEVFRMYDKGRFKLVYSNTSMPNGTNINYNLTSMPLSVQEGMVLLMHFDNDSSMGENDTHVYDWSGMGNNGTSFVNNSDGSFRGPNATGKFGRAYEFDGLDDHINISDSASLNPADWTISAWFKVYVNSSMGGGQNIVNKFEDFGDTDYLMDFNEPEEELRCFYVNSSNWREVISGNDSVSINEFHHGACVYDSTGNTLNLYLDGGLVDSVDTTGVPPPKTGADVHVGNHLTYGNRLNGTIDELAIWNRSLTASEISNIYSLQVGRYYWKGNVTDGSLSGESETWWFEINATYAPNITLHSPPNASSTTDSYVVLNATINDDNDIDTNIYVYYSDEIDGSETGLLTLYHFNNDSTVGENDTHVYDWSANNNNAVCYGSNCSVFGDYGKFKGGFRFDGINDTFEIGGSASIIGTGPFAVSLWIKTEGSDYQYIISQRNDTLYNGEYMLAMKSTGQVEWITYGDGAYGFDINTTRVFNDGQWHHIVGTRESDGAGRVYVDGTLEAEDPGTARTLIEITVYIGGDERNEADYFQGYLDEIAIWNRTLSAQEVFRLYDKGRWKLVYSNTSMPNGTNINYNLTSMPLSVQEGMVLLMHFDNDSSMGENDTHVYDWTGLGNNGTAYVNNSDGSTRGANATGRFGWAYEFDGDDYIIQDNTIIANDSTWTISAWIKKVSDISTPHTVYGEGNSSTLNYAYLFGVDSSYDWAFFGVKNSTGEWTNHFGTTNVSDNNWHQIVALSKNKTYRELYVDGTMENYSTTDIGDILTDFSTIGALRRSSQIAGFFNGTIDEVAIWNRSLTASEISAIYSLQTGRYYWFGNVTDGSLTNESDVWWFEINETSNTEPNITLHSPPNASSTTDNYVVLNATITDDSNDIDTNLYVYYADEIDSSDTDLWNGLVALYHFNNDSVYGENSSLFYDFSGNGFNGTCDLGSGYCPAAESGRFFGAMQFDGADDYINTTFDGNMDTDYTLCAWFNKREYEDFGTIIGVLPEKGANDPIIEIITDHSGFGKVEAYIRDDAGNHETVNSSLNYSLNKWYHTCLVRDSVANTLSISLDGIKRTIADATTDSFPLSGYPFFIGARNSHGSASDFFNGTIDEFAIYNRSLSAQEVMRLYDKGRWKLVYSNTSMSNGTNINYNLTSMPLSVQEGMVLLMHFDNDSSMGENDTHVYDWTGMGNNGTAYVNNSDSSTRGPNATGRFGWAYEFDGVDDYVSMDTDIFDSLAEGSISAWFYFSQPPNEPKVIFSYQDNAGTANQMQITYLNISKKIQIWIKTSSTERILGNSTSNITPGNWYHVVFTINSSGNNLYLNGELENFTYKYGSSSTAYFFDDYSAGNAWPLIGARTSNGVIARFWNGTIDELAIWNRSLTASEISAMYSLQAGRYYWKGNVTDGSLSGESEIWWFEIEDDVVGPNISFVSPTPQNDTTQPETYVEINVSINTTTLSEFVWNWNGTNYTFYDNDLVLLMNFDNVSALGENDTYVVDMSNYGHNATVNGSAAWNSTGKYGGAFDFDGIDNNIDAGSPSTLDELGPLTVSAWIKPDNAGESNAGQIVVKGKDDFANGDWHLEIDNTAPETNAFEFEKVGSTSVKRVSVDNSISFGNWQHIVATWDGSTTASNIHLYKDGVELTYQTTQNGVTLGSDANLPLVIGGFENGSFSFDGLIDEVRIFNHTLSAEEIQILYMSNLNKYDTDKWLFYINQTKNATAGLDDGVYTYQAFAADTDGNWNQTEERWITIGASPAINQVNITPTTAYFDDTFNCSVNATDNQSSSINVSFTWWVNGALNTSWDTNVTCTNSTWCFTDSYPSGFLKHYNITCSARAFDGSLYSKWKNSTVVELSNYAPSNVTLLNPAHGNNTILSRRPIFNWTNATDPENDSLTFQIMLLRGTCGSPLACTGSANITDNTTDLNFTPSEDLDLDTWYNWSVRVYDGEAWSSWSETWNLSILSTSIITLNDSIQFGSGQPGDINDTQDNIPKPFLIENNGNVKVNVSIRAQTALWSSQPLNTIYFRFAAGNSTETSAFDWAQSQITWANINTSNQLVISYLNFTSNDSAEIDIYIQVPGAEPTGDKSSTLIMEAVYSG